MIDANSRRPGLQVALGPLLTQHQYMTIRADADNDAGAVWIAVSQINPAPPVNGSGILAQLSFRAVAPGESAIHLTSIQLADRDGQEISAAMADGSIAVAVASYTIWFPAIVL